MKDGVRKIELDDAFLEIKKDGVRKSKDTKKVSKNDKNEWFTVEVR